MPGLWRSRQRSVLSLLLLCLAVYVPGLFVLPPIDRDEARFAQASREMVETGDWIVPRVQGSPRLNKPPLIYWLQSMSVKVFGDEPPAAEREGSAASTRSMVMVPTTMSIPTPTAANASPTAPADRTTRNMLAAPSLGKIWVFRLPSVLFAIGAVFITWRIGLSMFNAQIAWLGAAFLAVCPIVAWDAHQARADQLLLALTAAAMAGLWGAFKAANQQSGRAASEERDVTAKSSGVPANIVESCNSHSASRPARPPLSLQAVVPCCLLWFALSLGILAKGPITPMVVGLAAVSISIVTRRWRWVLSLRPVLGVLIVASVVGPWVWMVGERVGWSIYLEKVYTETIGRSTSASEGHWAPPGYHLILVVVLLWPGSMLAGLGVRSAWRHMRGKDLPVMWERAGISRQLPAATRAPAEAARSVPAETFLLAWLLPTWIVFEFVSTKLPHYPMPLYPALALLAARAVVLAERDALAGLQDRLTRIGLWIWRIVSLVLSLPTAFWVWRNLARREYVAASVWAMLGWVIVFGVVVQWVLPAYVSGSVRVEQALRTIDPMRERPFASVGYHEDSLVFLTRGAVEKIDLDDVIAWAAANGEPGSTSLSATTRASGGVILMPSADYDLKADALRAVGVRPVAGAATMNILNYSNGKRLALDWYEVIAPEPTSGGER